MKTPLDDLSRLPSHDVMCIDCKSFYASVEAIRRGEYPLAAKIAVMSNEESQGGLILAASPLTKKNYGIKLGTRRFQINDDMDIEMVEPHMSDYIVKNYGINRIFRQFTDDAHWYPYSIDESFIDVTHSHKLFGSNEEIAAAIQDRVFDQFGIITTVGMGENPLLAKLALDNAAKKQAPWRASWGYKDVPDKVWKIQNITDFWGIGSHLAERLCALHINSIADLAQANRGELHDQFGVLGDQLYFHAWGIDYSDLARRYLPRNQNKGYSNNQVLMRDYIYPDEIETVLSEIADQVATRLRNHHVQGEVVGIFLGFAEPDSTGRNGYTPQMKIDPTNRTDDLIQTVRYLFQNTWHGEALRNVGVRVNRISNAQYLQTSLFHSPIQQEADIKLERAIDNIRTRYGYKSLVRGFSKTKGGTAIKRAGLVGGHQG
ncbi:MAG: Y-family DNA polymerase [Schleiferilactobacillus perolens]|jgi:DNA polymerase V|uniref:Y-family DNA polymerase n=1 Tax=Schleiferilactobacillus perolens TaxID=100468 RepID=UPI0039EAD35A|nr:Y-family DNA polymerase [Schleiferilactobacillus harbinensis]MCI1913690.1 Y-family DNA polymerase [Schleiferilactobacillus harbinensis]